MLWREGGSWRHIQHRLIRFNFTSPKYQTRWEIWRNEVNVNRIHGHVSSHISSYESWDQVEPLLCPVHGISWFDMACKGGTCSYLARSGWRGVPEDWTSFIEHGCGNMDFIPISKWKWSGVSHSIAVLKQCLGEVGPYFHQLNLRQPNLIATYWGNINTYAASNVITGTI